MPGEQIYQMVDTLAPQKLNNLKITFSEITQNRIKDCTLQTA